MVKTDKPLTSSKDWQKRTDLVELEIQKLRTRLGKLTAEKSVFVSKKRGAEKREARAKVAGEMRGRGEKYPGHCLACVYRMLGKAGGKKHNKSRCKFTKSTPKEAFKK